MANTVVLTPANYEANGWSIDARRGCDGGSIAKSVGAFEVVPSPPAGYGGFHMKVFEFYPTRTPAIPRVYFGTNEWSNPSPSVPAGGVNVKDIWDLRYSVKLLSRCYYGQPQTGDPWGQPPILELTCWSGEMRIFRYYPWGINGHFTNDYAWHNYDCMRADGVWVMMNTSSANYSGNWDWLIDRYPTITIYKPPKTDFTSQTNPVNPYPTGNPTGSGVNFVVGAGKMFETWHDAWWKESCGVDAYIDNFTLNYQVPGGDYVDKTYDFEYAVPTPQYALNNKSAKDTIIASAKSKARFVIYGKVLADPPPGTDYFYVDDGSGVQVRVNAIGHTVSANQYVRASGVLNRVPTPAQLDSSGMDIDTLVY